MRKYKAKDIAEMYGVTNKTARLYMHEMGCEVRPLRVSESQLAAWVKSRERLSAADAKRLNRLLKQRERLTKAKARART